MPGKLSTTGNTPSVAASHPADSRSSSEESDLRKPLTCSAAGAEAADTGTGSSYGSDNSILAPPCYNAIATGGSSALPNPVNGPRRARSASDSTVQQTRTGTGTENVTQSIDESPNSQVLPNPPVSMSQSVYAGPPPPYAQATSFPNCPQIPLFAHGGMFASDHPYYHAGGSLSGSTFPYRLPPDQATIQAPHQQNPLIQHLYSGVKVGIPWAVLGFHGVLTLALFFCHFLYKPCYAFYYVVKCKYALIPCGIALCSLAGLKHTRGVWLCHRPSSSSHTAVHQYGTGSPIFWTTIALIFTGALIVDSCVGMCDFFGMLYRGCVFNTSINKY